MHVWCVLLRESLNVIWSTGAGNSVIQSTRPQYSPTQDLKWNDACCFDHLHDVMCYYFVWNDVICDVIRAGILDPSQCYMLICMTFVTDELMIFCVDRVRNCLGFLMLLSSRTDSVLMYFTRFTVFLKMLWFNLKCHWIVSCSCWKPLLTLQLFLVAGVMR